HHPRASRRDAEAVGGGRYRRPDGRTVIELAGLQVRDRRLHDWVVEREWHLGERLPSKRDHADPIRLSRGDESLHRLFGDLQTILGLEVEREHRAGEIDAEDNVDAL